MAKSSVLFRRKLRAKLRYAHSLRVVRVRIVIDYTDDKVKYVVISGIVDDDIKKDVLSYSDLDNKTLNDTISLIDCKEMAVRAMSAKINDLTLAAATGYKQSSSMQEKLSMKTSCRNCSK